MKSKINFSSIKSLQKIHNKSIDVLRNTGMKINNSSIINMLKSKGCKVDIPSNRVYFKPELVEWTIEDIKKSVRSKKLVQNILNGPLASKTDGKLRLKFGGACIEFYDYEKNELRRPTYEDIVNSIQLGEAIPEIELVGNTMMYIEEDGKEVEPRLQRIKTCEIIAKNTSKPGSTEIWNVKELDLQVEMGIVIRGSKEEFIKNPCFITAKEPITPLVLEKEAAEILLALAERDLPCTIIPMPITGISVPLARESAIVIGNAEILGSMTALRAIYSEAKVAGGMTSGSVNMRTGSACFASPESIIQDLILAELYEKLYEQDFGIGVGNIDAKYPGIEATSEKITKILTSFLSGRTNYLIGVLASITRFSPEQAIIELELAKYIHEIFKGIEINKNNVPLDLINKIGPGGNFFQDDHTILNFKKNLWLTDIFDKSLTVGKISEDKNRDILINANRFVKEVMSKNSKYHLPEDKEREINKIIKKAEEIL